MQRSKTPQPIEAAELEPLMTAKEAAPFAGMPASWLLRQAYAGAIPCHRPGGRRFVRFSKQDCVEIQASFAVRPISEIQPKSARG